MEADKSIVKQVLVDALPFSVPTVPFSFVLALAVVESGIDRWPKAVAAVVAAATAYAASGLPYRSGLLVGAIAGIAVGVIIEKSRP